MYGDFAEMVDSMIGRVLATLDRTGMSEDTLLVFTSDNGPVWYEADVERFQHDSSGGLRGMKADAWEAGHRLPFIVRWPNMVAAGSTSQQTICFTDIMATLASISGYPLSADDAPDSFDFSAGLARDGRSRRACTTIASDAFGWRSDDHSRRRLEADRRTGLGRFFGTQESQASARRADSTALQPQARLGGEHRSIVAAAGNRRAAETANGSH